MAQQTELSIIDRYRTIIIALALGASGIVLLIFGYYTDPAHTSHPFPFISFLLEQIGAIALFTGVYTVISDYFVRKNFEKQITETINFVRIDQSIKDFGIAEIKPKFVWEDAIQAIDQASSVQMLILRSNSFFDGNYAKLRERLQGGDFSLKVILPNPSNAALISLLATKFSNISRPQELADSIVTVVNVWLKKQIYDHLPVEQQSKISVYFVNKYPLYSAYLFDRKQFWYVPYHYRNDRQDLPVFVFESDFARSEVYRDFDAFVKEATKHDLNKLLTTPAIQS